MRAESPQGGPISNLTCHLVAAPYLRLVTRAIAVCRGPAVCQVLCSTGKGGVRVACVLMGRGPQMEKRQEGDLGEGYNLSLGDLRGGI